MLIDENYQGIYAGLELELAKLYQIQNKNDEYISRLNGIVKDYPRTKESAESSFLLGESTLIKSREFDDALRYYSMVRSEFRSSLFNKSAQLRIKEINTFSKLKNEYDIWVNAALLDSAKNMNLELIDYFDMKNFKLIRENGLSQNKIKSIMGAKEAIQNGAISMKIIQELPYEEYKDLVKSLWGFGDWSAEMIAIFYLGRTNVCLLYTSPSPRD